MEERTAEYARDVEDVTPTILPEEIEKGDELGTLGPLCSKWQGAGQFGVVCKGKCRGMDVAVKYLENFDESKLLDFLDEGVLYNLRSN